MSAIPEGSCAWSN